MGRVNRLTPLALLAVCAPAWAAAADDPLQLDLAEVLRRSDEHNPLNARGWARYRQIEARTELARLAWLGKGSWKNDFAAIPVCSDPVTLDDGLSVCWDDLDEVDYLELMYRPHLRGSVEYGWPLYTFGKVSAGMDMAEAGLKAGADQRDATRAEGRFLAKKAYWGALLFGALGGVADQGLSHLDEARAKLAEALDEDDEGVDERDAWKLDVFRAEVVSQVEKARAGARLAEAGLREATGVGRRRSLSVVGELSPADGGVPSLADSFARTLDANKTVRAARGAVAVAAAEEKLARAKFWPDLLLGVGATYRATVSRTDCLPDLADRTQQCKTADFAPIPVPALRLKWTINPASQISSLKKAEAQVQVAKADLRALEAKLRLDVEQAWRGVERGRVVLQAREVAVKAGKRLVVAASMDREAGVGSAKDLSDALKASAMARAARLQTIYELNIAVATLSKLTGDDLENLPAPAASNPSTPPEDAP